MFVYYVIGLRVGMEWVYSKYGMEGWIDSCIYDYAFFRISLN